MLLRCFSFAAALALLAGESSAQTMDFGCPKPGTTFAFDSGTSMTAHSRDGMDCIMQKSGGSIVNITASLADHPLAALNASVAMITKGGINAASRSLALEYAKEGIRVNVVAPGIVSTPLTNGFPQDFLRSLSPMGQIASVQDIAEAVWYLSQASQVTGEVLHVDGGSHLGHW